MKPPLFTSSNGLTILGILSCIWLALLANHYIDIGRNATARPPTSDFYKFYISAQRVDAGLSMYWMVPPRLKKGDPCHPDTPSEEAQIDYTPSRLHLGGDLPCLGPNLNPPIFTAVLLPLSRLAYGQAWWIWGIFSIICTTIFAMVAAFEFGHKNWDRFRYTMIFCALVFSFYPTLASFTLGQLGSVLALLLLLSWRSAKNHRDISAAMFLGTVLAIKPIFGVLWLGLLVIKRWRYALWSAAFALALNALGMAFFGLQAYEDYTKVAGNVHWTAANWNASWFGLFDRAYSGQSDSNWPTDRPLSNGLSLIATSLTLFISALVLHKSSVRNASSASSNLFMIGLPATLLISPLGWMYYFQVLMIGVIANAYSTREMAPNKRSTQLLLGLVLIMCSIPTSIKPSPSPENPTLWFSMDSWYWLSALLVWIVYLSLVLRNKKGAH